MQSVITEIPSALCNEQGKRPLKIRTMSGTLKDLPARSNAQRARVLMSHGTSVRAPNTANDGSLGNDPFPQRLLCFGSKTPDAKVEKSGRPPHGCNANDF